MSSKLTIAVAAMNQTDETKGQWGCHVQNIVDKENTELLVIDNGSTDGLADFLQEFIFPYFPDHRIIRNEENIGVVASMQQAVNEAKGEIIAILHNDLYTLEYGWDQKVQELFKNERVGLAGFLGATKAHQNGGREYVYSNMMEAEIHGTRETKPRRVVLFDGMALIGRRKMFEEVGGFDQAYSPHHGYDKDISMASHLAGYENWLLPIYCHHRSGVTANRPDYQTWADKKMGTTNYTGDQRAHTLADERYRTKWAKHLPASI